jgi:hypothetical protein
MKEEGYEWDAEKKKLKKINLIKAEHGKYYYCIKDYFSGGKKFSSKGDVVQALRGLPIMALEDISEYFIPVKRIVDDVHKNIWHSADEVPAQDDELVLVEWTDPMTSELTNDFLRYNSGTKSFHRGKFFINKDEVGRWAYAKDIFN